MHAKYFTPNRHYPSLAAPKYSALDMIYMFIALAVSTTFFFIILMPLLPAPALQWVAVAAGTTLTYLIRHSPRILRRARLAAVRLQIRRAHNP
ncbi:hypothetical protein MZK47_14015 [Microbacterium aerolatum]|uniref:hypothetical protein n=1 Tax=Microbacterium TaxID=33882 RepID=UPI00097BEE0C|nr:MULTISPECIES: hypothetical protein [Microbacterium]MCK3770792.1 hypothetical protein [Microbacterium aerolatum]ONI66741.1 hypothetical protein CSIV_00465 [Microbacterium sp. CSI-V]